MKFTTDEIEKEDIVELKLITCHDRVELIAKCNGNTKVLMEFRDGIYRLINDAEMDGIITNGLGQIIS